MLAPLLSIVPTLPFTDPVLIVALATLLFLIVPVLAERVRVPGVIGLIVAGAAVGPHGFGLLARDQTIILLGTVGLLYLMLMVGLELDLHQFSRYRNRSIVFGTLSFLVPALFGAAAGLAHGLLPALRAAAGLRLFVAHAARVPHRQPAGDHPQRGGHHGAGRHHPHGDPGAPPPRRRRQLRRAGARWTWRSGCGSPSRSASTSWR